MLGRKLILFIRRTGLLLALTCCMLGLVSGSQFSNFPSLLPQPFQEPSQNGPEEVEEIDLHTFKVKNGAPTSRRQRRARPTSLLAVFSQSEIAAPAFNSLV